jgi:hypothetical protein
MASLSVDLDNQWSYMKTHGDPGWDSFPSYLDLVVPRILSLLDELDLTVTFFIVGQDAALQKNQDALRAIAAAGHEIANHSFHHDPWIHLSTQGAIEDELALAEEHIERATGARPVGYRGPGYSLSQATLKALRRRGYLYDATTLPTFIGPLARAYYFVSAHLSDEEKRQRKALFGSLADGFRPIRPYRWQVGGEVGGDGLIEIPVTTLPFFRIPFHFSYIQYMARFSAPLALRYFQAALVLCHLTSVQPSLLLHPLDFLGSDDLEGLGFFPAMNLASEAKLLVVRKALIALSTRYRVSTVKGHALSFSQSAEYRAAERSFGAGRAA